MKTLQHQSWPVGGDEMGAMVRARDWASTPLGPKESWPAALKTAVSLALDCEFPMIVLWGPELVQIYNDGYRDIMGRKHPEGLGQRTRECWPEVWDINEPVYARVWRGETITFADRLFPITRRGNALPWSCVPAASARSPRPGTPCHTGSAFMPIWGLLGDLAK